MITESQFKVADLSIDLVSRKVSRAGNRIVLTSKVQPAGILHSPSGRFFPAPLVYLSRVWDMVFAATLITIINAH